MGGKDSTCQFWFILISVVNTPTEKTNARDSYPWYGTHANRHVDLGGAFASIEYSTAPFWLFSYL